MNVELPRDAEGREIPLDTEVPYDRYGFENLVKSFMYAIRTDTRTGAWRVKSTIGTSLFAVSDMHLAEPDSREKPDEDLHAARPLRMRGRGKGAPVSDEVPLTLSTGNTQTLFSEEGGDMAVRRLTPRECERPQGFPDDRTKIPYRGKPADECPDGPRHKAIGDGMAGTAMRRIGEGIAMAEAGDIS